MFNGSGTLSKASKSVALVLLVFWVGDEGCLLTGLGDLLLSSDREGEDDGEGDMLNREW